MSASQPKRVTKLVVSNRASLLIPAAIILVTVAVDQISKIWAVNLLAEQPTREVLGRFLMLTLVYNEGGALGTSFGSSAYYLVSSLIILAVVFYYLFVNRYLARIAWPLAFTAAGAIGNIIDRIRLGKVIDFIDIDIIDINLGGFHLDRWWTFNVADAAISCSIVFLLFTVLFSRHRQAPVSTTAAVEIDSQRAEGSGGGPPDHS